MFTVCSESARGKRGQVFTVRGELALGIGQVLTVHGELALGTGEKAGVYSA